MRLVKCALLVGALTATGCRSSEARLETAGPPTSSETVAVVPASDGDSIVAGVPQNALDNLFLSVRRAADSEGEGALSLADALRHHLGGGDVPAILDAFLGIVAREREDDRLAWVISYAPGATGQLSSPVGVQAPEVRVIWSFVALDAKSGELINGATGSVDAKSEGAR